MVVVMCPRRERDVEKDIVGMADGRQVGGRCVEDGSQGRRRLQKGLTVHDELYLQNDKEQHSKSRISD